VKQQSQGFYMSYNTISQDEVKNKPPIFVQYSEKSILYRMMLGRNIKNMVFVDERNENIANYIYSFREAWIYCGLNTDNFINYLSSCRALELCGGADYIRSIFGNFEDSNGVII
jgi:hypothetical protein